MAHSFRELNEQFAALQREFNEAQDNQVRAVILDEMHGLLDEMKKLLHPEELNEAVS